MRHLIFIFDTNAHTQIIDNLDFSGILSKISDQNKTILPHFTHINFYEYLFGVNEHNIGKMQNYVKNIFRLTQGGSVFPDPISHVQSTTGHIGMEQVSSQIKNFIANIKSFLRLENYEEFMAIFGNHIEMSKKDVVRIVDGYKDMAKKTTEIRNKFQTEGRIQEYNNWIHTAPTDEDMEIFLQHTIKRFKLNPDEIELNIERFQKELPAIIYFAHVFWHYVQELVLNKRKPRRGDYWDLEQIVYLNIADYLVTGDRPLRHLINNACDPNLEGRAISPQEFIRLIDQDIIVPRAPQPNMRISIPANEIG